MSGPYPDGSPSSKNFERVGEGSKKPVYLRTHAEFVAAQKGERRNLGFATALICSGAQPNDPARFGLTVSRKTAKRAVDRNRIKRRLRAAIAFCCQHSGEPNSGRCGRQGFDLVLVARRQVLTTPFSQIIKALSDCVSTPPPSRSKHRSAER